MNYQEIMEKYIRIGVPLDKIKYKVEAELREIETLSGQEDNSYKQLQIYKYMYMFLTILMIVILNLFNKEKSLLIIKKILIKLIIT